MSLRTLYAILFTFMTIGGLIQIYRVIALNAPSTTLIPTIIFTAIAILFMIRFWRKERRT